MPHSVTHSLTHSLTQECRPTLTEGEERERDSERERERKTKRKHTNTNKQMPSTQDTNAHTHTNTTQDAVMYVSALGCILSQHIIADNRNPLIWHTPCHTIPASTNTPPVASPMAFWTSAGNLGQTLHGRSPRLLKHPTKAYLCFTYLELC